jgi:membrane associated rhomboid family serine protease
MFPLYDNIPRQHVPVATWLIILANGVVFAVELMLPAPALEQFVYRFGLVPARFSDPAWGTQVCMTANCLWPFLTSQFLHGGWLHIIFNMWALWIFGDNVEDRLGHARFLVFYLVCGIICGVVQVWTSLGSTMPTIGASGAIAGVLGAYVVLFPFAQIIVLFPVLFIPLFFTLPAVLYIGFWFLLQFASGTASLLSTSVATASNIAWWAHVGGFSAGVLLHRLFMIGRPVRRRVYGDEYGARGAWFHG